MSKQTNGVNTIDVIFYMVAGGVLTLCLLSFASWAGCTP